MAEQIFTFKLKNTSIALRRLIARETNDSWLLAELAKETDKKLKIEVAKNKYTNSTTLKILSLDKSPDVREEVAKNKNTTSDVLSVLAKDKTLYVRECVASNPNTPTKVVGMLVEEYLDDPSWCIQRAVANNPNISKQTLKVLQKKVNEIRETINPYFKL